jgi:hypothetical protein
MMKNSIINTPDQHGFILNGTEALYICHLPMFNMKNHMYQITLEVTISPEAKAAYLQDKQANPGNYYVLGNLQTDLFTIPDVMLGKTKNFQADIFRNMPADPNKDTPLIHNVTTSIKRVVYARHFDYAISYPDDLTYILFGNEKEAFLDHYLTAEEDFLNIIAVTKVPDWLPIDQLAISANVSFIGIPATPMPENPPLAPDTYKVSFQGQEAMYELETGEDIFFDTEIVNMPAEQTAMKGFYVY